MGGVRTVSTTQLDAIMGVDRSGCGYRLRGDEKNVRAWTLE